MIDVKTLAGDRYRITLDPFAEIDTCRENRVFYYRIPAKYGFISVHGENTLAAYRNTTAFHALPNDDIPLREEVVPIPDIRITLSSEYRLTRVHLKPGGQELRVGITPAGSTVVVPRLDVHAMVAGELELAVSR
jgi:hypothetical protein